MRLAFTTLGCPDWTLERAIAAAEEYGYEGIELRLLDGEVITAALAVEQRERVARCLAQSRIALVCLDTSVRLAQPDPQLHAEQLAEGRGMLDLAARWGAPMIRVFGGPPPEIAQDKAERAAAEMLALLADRGRELGVAVMLETHDAFSRSDSVARVLAQVPSAHAGALWDTLHPCRFGEQPAETLANLRGRVLHVHIKDGRPPADGGESWDLTLLGDGAVPFASIFAALRDVGYDGWLAVEWEKKWHPRLAPPEVALPQHIAALRTLL